MNISFTDNLACNCQPWLTCEWSKGFVEQISILPKDNELRQEFSQQFALQICDRDKQHVLCCHGSERASQSELEEFRLIKQGRAIPDQIAKEGMILFPNCTLEIDIHVYSSL